jgi:hypothetical protein
MSLAIRASSLTDSMISESQRQVQDDLLRVVIYDGGVETRRLCKKKATNVQKRGVAKGTDLFRRQYIDRREKKRRVDLVDRTPHTPVMGIMRVTALWWQAEVQLA